MCLCICCTEAGKGCCTPNSCPTGPSSPKVKLILLQTLAPAPRNHTPSPFPVLAQGPLPSPLM